MKFLGIQFAPFSLPLERRLQTLAVLHWQSTFILGPIFFSVLAIVLLFIPYYNIIVILYLVFLYFDHVVSSRGGRRYGFLRRMKIWHYFRDYFPISLHKTVDLPADHNYIFGYHPHGILGAGAFCNFGTEATGFSKLFPGILPHPLSLKVVLCWPFLREYFLGVGVCDVSRQSLNHILTTKPNSGSSAIIVIGGAEEALYARPHMHKLKLKERKGFVKVALQTGASLVPVFSFGENDIFEQAENPDGSALRSFQNRFKRIFGFSPPIFYGRGIFNYSFGFMPFRHEVHTVVGSPIHVTKVDHPSNEEINKLHDEYIQSLTHLFDEHKIKYGVSAETELQFI